MTSTSALVVSVEQTLACGSARISFTRPDPDLSRLVGRGGRGRGLAGRLLEAVEPAPLRLEGAIDFVAGRCAVGGRDRALLVVGDRWWAGKPGSRVRPDHGKPALSLQPLWVFDLCRGVVDSRPADVDESHPTWRTYSAQAELDRVQARVGYALPDPVGFGASGRVTRVPLAISTDQQGFVRRVRLTPQDMIELTLDLSDFALPIPESYWLTLPSCAPAGN